MVDDERLPWEDIEDEDQVEETPVQQPEFDLTQDPDVVQLPDEEEDTAKKMWLAMETYFNMGLSMMWGRAENDPVKKKKAKSPLVTTWSSEIETKFSLQALASMMHKEAAHIKVAPIIICGKASGNLIVIDVDVKHMPGIDGRFLLAIQETYPNLYKIIRRHRTPSKGKHLLYRTEVHIEFPSKNPGLAYPKEGKMAGIESRTHGGYVLAPPGLGYEVEYDVPIPTLTVQEHEALFALARIFNERTITKAPPRQKQYESIYTENPFEHFNSSPAAENVLKNNGWDFDYENTQFAHWTRPGKGGGVSASWHKEKRFYHFFTTSTEIDTSKWNGNYSPANVRCILECNGDWKRLYKVLADEGYGKHKPDYEAKVIRKLKETNKALPANFSEEAKVQLQVAIAEKNEKYPHGIYWEYNPANDSFIIQRELLSQFMNRIGLRLHKGQPCIIEGQFIRKLKEDKKANGEYDVYTILKSWIREEEEDVFKRISHEFSKFWQASGEFMVSKLEKLDENLVLKSSASTCYKFFLNGILEITKEGKPLLEYKEKESSLVWSDSIIQREYHYIDQEAQRKSMYVDYLDKGIYGTEEYKKLVVGYLAHDNKKGEQYLTCLLEPMATDEGGGTGKNSFCYMLSPWTTVLTTDAQALKRDVDQLIQNWNGERVVHLSDFPEWTRLGRLKNIITDDSQRKLLYKDITNVSKDDMPKFVLSGQHGLDTESDGGVKRRVRIVSFTGYFNRDHGLRDEYGGEWPEVWDDPKRADNRDWDGYFSYMADAVQYYLEIRRVPVVQDLRIWIKGFDIRYSGGDSYLREGIEDKIEYWGSLGTVASKEVLLWYEDLYGGRSSRGKLSDKMLHKALREYGREMKRYEYDYGDHIKREYIDGAQQRVVKIRMIGEVEVEKDPWD